jgi:hypothetical protein
MSDNQKRILDLLTEKKISVDEAQRLLSLTEPEKDTEAKTPYETAEPKRKPRYFRVQVQPEAGSGKESVNVRIPMALIHAGMKLTYLIPGHASDDVNEALREKGINFDVRNFKEEDFEELVAALTDLEVDVKGGREKVHIYVE